MAENPQLLASLASRARTMMAAPISMKSAASCEPAKIAMIIDRVKGEDTDGRSLSQGLLTGPGEIRRGSLILLEPGTAALAKDRIPIMGLQPARGADPDGAGRRCPGNLEGYDPGRHRDDSIAHDHQHRGQDAS